MPAPPLTRAEYLERCAQDAAQEARTRPDFLVLGDGSTLIIPPTGPAIGRLAPLAKAPPITGGWREDT